MCVSQMQCQCCSCQGGKPNQQPPTTPPVQPPNTTSEQCTCTVLFTTIDIHDNGETSKGEWQLEMSVNGVVKRWVKGSVTEQTYTLNKEFTLPNCDTPINISVSGWELDSGSSSGGFFDFMEDNNDRLSDFSAQYASPHSNPSVVQSYERRTSNATGDYTIHYQILKACKQVKTISAQEVMKTMKNYSLKLQKAGIELKAKTEDEMLNYAISRLKRSNWRVIGAIGDRFIIEGYMPILKKGKPLTK